MRRIAGMLLVVLCSVILVNAQNQYQSEAKAMSGTICPSACVSQSNNVATCKQSCTDQSGPAVFVSDTGQVSRIRDEDQSMCKSHMGKHVKMMAAPMSQNPGGEDILRIFRMQESGGVGG